MSHSSPRVSVIVPTYNRSHLVGETLESIQKQTLSDWECLIVDDGSTDDTQAVAESFASSDGKDRFHYFYQENSGAQVARNHGFAKSSGLYIQFLDSDDLIDEIKLERQVEGLEETGADYAHCAWRQFHMQDGKRVLSRIYADGPIPGGDHLSAEFRGWHPAPNSYLFRRETVEQVGPWDEELTQNQDLDYAFRLGLTYLKSVFTAGTALHREHQGERISSHLNEQTARSRKRVLQKVERLLQESGRYDTYRPDLACIYAMYALQVHSQDSELSKKWFLRSREIGIPSTPLRQGWFRMAWRILGPKMAGRLLDWSHRLRNRNL